MARYIDADKLFRYVDEQTHISKGKLQNYIRENHTVDVVEVKHGEWISNEFGNVFICSECGRRELTNIEPYCHCGAKMDGGS